LQRQREAAEIFPVARRSLLPLTPAQVSLLSLFAVPEGTGADSEGTQTGMARG